ncbi:TlpA family protein disulfide reductase [Crocinitomix catalasitica]|uniref:TlpA family protein disulfide reductase n=1 Tax=Crocinitomix catalasitica TaxID=184607 RepID=UPI000480F2C8|nr:TlpA disulfide reductase family protein [Crocinitomix catalasitica]
MKIIFLLCIALATNLVWSQNDNQPILTINIIETTKDSMTLLDNEYLHIKTFTVENGNKITFGKELEAGYYKLGPQRQEIYIGEEFNLIASYNEKADNSFLFSGNGAKENEYLGLKNTQFEELNGMHNYMSDETDFLRKADSVNTEFNQLFNEYKSDFHKDFMVLETKDLEYEHINRLADYRDFHGFITDNREFKVSENFPRIFKDFDYDNVENLKVPHYLGLVERYFRNEVNNQVWEDEESKDYFLEFLLLIDQAVENEKIKEVIAIKEGIYSLKKTKQIDSLYVLVKKLAGNHRLFPKVTSKYEQIQHVLPGKVAPQFTYVDTAGTAVSLSDFKGKLVYIDIWNRGCTPCIKAMPTLNKLKDSFSDKNIVFLNISIDNTEDWLAAIAKYNVKGINLNAPKNNNPFFEAFDVFGYPRYILIDQEGKIIDPNAKHPSHPGLVEELQSHL